MNPKALQTLSEEGKFQEVIDKFTRMEIQGTLAALSPDDQIKCVFYQCFSLSLLNRAEEALELSTTMRKKLTSPNEKSLLLALLSQQLMALYMLGRLDKGLELSTEGDAIMKDLMANERQTGAFWIAVFEHGKGDIYRNKGELDRALDNYQRALAKFEALDNSYWVVLILNDLGRTYSYKGQVDTALEYFKRVETGFEALGHPWGIARYLNHIGDIYHIKGELDKALEYYQRSLKFYEEVGSDIETATSIFNLLLLTLDKQDQIQAQAYQLRLQQLHSHTSNQWVHLYSRLADALILKQSPRMVDKAQAQIILKNIVNDENIRFDLTALAMIHLCELFILEVKVSDDPNLWEEAKNQIQQLYIQAQDQRLFTIIIEALILKARLATIEGELQQTLEYYDKARETAEEKHLHLLIQKLNAEKTKFEAEIEKWQTLIQRNTSLQERLKHGQLEEYLREVQKRLKLMKD
ncbi:MAG: tetratricopeptide repeat protein [Promethearchaeota archaeon]